jgi:iron-sulfur cluster assembly accessory protein
MVIVTEKAAREIKRVFESQGKPDALLRVYVSGGGCSGLSYGMAIEDAPEEGDQVFAENGVQIVVDPKSYMYIAGAKIDWATDQMMGGGFKIENPNAARSCGCGHSFQPNEGEAAPAAAGGCGSCSSH